MRMRTIDSGFEEIIKDDPNTSLTKTALRRLVVSGKLKSQKIGAKYLFDLDELEAYMGGCGYQSILSTVDNKHGIRRLPEKL